MKFLFDTSFIIYVANNDRKLNPRTLELILNSDNFISPISVWEIIQKHKSGKLTLPESPLKMIDKVTADLNSKFLDFSAEDVLQLENLPEIHKDPFDRMLICQTINNGLTLVTDDKFIAKYPIKTIW